MADPSQTHPSFRDATLVDADFTNATLRSCDLSGLRVADGWIVDVDLSGMVRNLRVNGVDVTPYVQAEMDRLVPERVRIRSMATADDFRAGWATIERVWASTIDRLASLPAGTAHARVDDEWSLVETLRHLVFAIDAWAQRTVLDQERPFHALGLPHAGYAAEQAAALGVDVAAAPTFDEAAAAWHDRCAVMRGIVSALDDADLDRVCTQTPAPGYPEGEVRTVARCLRVVMDEALEHSVYANRDLDTLA